MANHRDKFNRPTAPKPEFHNIPPPLIELTHWVLWRFDWSDDRAEWAKVPYQPCGLKAKSNDRETWSTLASVKLTYLSARSSYDGVGFVFSADCPYVGVDLDECVVDEGDSHRLSGFAIKVLDKLGSYTELSPSKTGLHIIGVAGEMEAMKTAWKGNKIEVYRKGRYFTFTGISWDEKPLEVKDIHAALDAVVTGIKQSKAQSTNGDSGKPSMVVGLNQRLEMALRKEKIRKLFLGDVFEYDGDDSRADLALCSMLAEFCDGSIEVLDQMFRQSKLYRDKWDAQRGDTTYGQMTIARALTNRDSYFGKKKVAQESASSVESRRAYRYGVDELFPLAMAYRKNPFNEGLKIGWDELDKIYRPRRGLLSIVTGEPGSGKSTLLDVASYSLARQYGLKMLYASFETQPLERHFLDLAQIHLGRPTFSFLPDSATDEEMEEAREALRPWCRWIGPQEHEMTLDSILEYAEDEIRENGVDGFILDPYSEIEDDSDVRVAQTRYIEKHLRKIRQFTRHHNILMWLVCHPSKSDVGYKDGRPTLRAISGSKHFENKADYGLVVHRNDDDTTSVFVDKVRFRETGCSRKKVEFRYDGFARMYVLANSPAGIEVAKRVFL